MADLYDPWKDPSVNAALANTGSAYRVPLPEGYDPNAQVVQRTIMPPEQPPMEAPEPQAPQAAPSFGGVDPSAVNAALANTGSSYQLTPPQVEPLDLGTPDESMTPLQGAMGELDEAAMVQGEAATRAADIKSQQYKGESAAHARYSREAEELLARHKDSRTAFDETNRATLSEIKRLNDEYSKMPPPRDRRSGISKLAHAFAVGAGQISDNYTGGNVSQQIQANVDTKIQRDFQEQREAIGMNRQDAQNRMTELGLAQKYFGDTMEADRYALGLVKDRTANELSQLAATTNSDLVKVEAQGLAAKYRAEAAKEKLDVYKTLLKKKLSAFDIVMMRQAGFTDAQIAEYAKQAGGNVDPTAASAPSARISGPVTKAGASAVNIDAARSEVPGLAPLQSAERISKDDTQAAQKMKSAHGRAVVIMQRAKAAYIIAVDGSKSDQERLAALQRYRQMTQVQLPGYMSQATGSGTPQEAEAQRVLESLPPAPKVNDIVGLKQSYQDASNWWNDRSTDPVAFDYAAEDFSSAVDEGLGAYKYRLAGPGDAAPQTPAQPTQQAKQKPGTPKKPGAKIPGLKFE